jgi:hypothetical protein
LGSESETCVGSRVRLVGVSISFEKNFYRLPFTPPLSGLSYRSFKVISNGLYNPVTYRFNLCNRLDLTSIKKSSCNERLRRPLLEVHIGNGHCRGQPRGQPAGLICNRHQITTITDVGACNGC